MPDLEDKPLEDREYPDEADQDRGDDPATSLAPCPQCGAIIYEDAPRCPKCGAYVVPSWRDWRGSRKWYVRGGLWLAKTLLWNWLFWLGLAAASALAWLWARFLSNGN